MLTIAYAADQAPRPGDTAVARVAIDEASARPYRLNMTTAAAAERATVVLDPDLYVACRMQALAACGTWGGLQRKFIDWYFDAVDQIATANAEVLHEKLRGLDGLYKVGDWRFSAMAPWPRAWLPCGDDTVQVDVAFWRGDRFVAIDTGSRTLSPKARIRAQQAITATGAELVAITAPDLAGNCLDLMTRIYGGTPAYWEGDILPSGPYGPAMPLSLA